MDALYSAQTIVTGQGVENRLIGFRDCLARVLVKVSGDQTITADAGFPPFLRDPGALVDHFRYHDRLEGIPIHDEQGTHDRPHDLTCFYQPAMLDPVLRRLGRKAWLGDRPRLIVLLAVQDQRRSYTLTADGSESPYMVESLQAAAAPMAFGVAVPSRADIDDARRRGAPVETIVGAGVPLTGRLVWNQADLGWVADWQMASGGGEHHWEIRGVSFDEAFRNAVKGAAQVLSGNGDPPPQQRGAP